MSDSRGSTTTAPGDAGAVTTDGPLVAVLDYGIGNLRSAQKALEHVGADARLTSDPGLIRDAVGIVLPGVGAFGRCMEALRESGLFDLAHETATAAATGEGRPFMGVCVGLQMLFDGSDENPDTPGLGVVPGRVELLPEGVKRPQMQWNTLHWTRPTAMSEGLHEPAWVYFVHSYWGRPDDPTDVVATCDYGSQLTAVVERGRLWATQFHPEKSATNGLQILENFVSASRA